MSFSEKLKGFPLYRYIPINDWNDIDNQGLQPTTTSGNRLYLTPHFFRFSEEDRVLLVLPGRNMAEVGIYIDPDYWIALGLAPIYQPLPPIYGAAGNGVQIILSQPIPRNAVIECFDLQNSSPLNQSEWDFKFRKV